MTIFYSLTYEMVADVYMLCPIMKHRLHGSLWAPWLLLYNTIDSFPPNYLRNL
jgi:hypothetical protein